MNVSKLGLVCISILFSSQSFAGIFCSEKFECDLEVSSFIESKAVFSGKVSREAHVMIFDPMGSGGKREELTNKNGMGIHIQAIGSRDALIARAYSIYENNPEIIMGKVDGVFYKNCKASKGTLEKRLITINLDCEKFVSTVKRSDAQKAAAMCVQAQLCAANIKDAEQIKDYTQLRDAVCANKDSVSSHDGELNSTGRHSVKEKEAESDVGHKTKSTLSK